MRISNAWPLALGLSLCLVAGSAEEASACGGCFAPPETPSIVNSHRMAVKITSAETILWDQIRYDGDPQDFAWVLPMPEVGAVELAEEGFFDALELSTAPQIFNPNPCFGGVPGAFAADSAGGNDADGTMMEEDVIVYYEGVVGPYETVTIGSEDPNALYDWLVERGYSVPESTLPTIARYVNMDHVFIALRLAPDFGVNQMQPVRVRIPGASLTFPLQMVKVGSGAKLGLTLWIFADSRYHSMNYPSSIIRSEDLVWDSALGRSNYVELFDKAVLDGGGKGWVTEFAQPADWVWLGGSTDAEEAVAGLSTPYLTRMRTDMEVALMDADLFLEPSWDTSNVSNQHFPTVDINPEFACGGNGPGATKTPEPGDSWLTGGGCSISSVSATGDSASLILAGALVLGLAVIRRRRTR